MIERLPNGQIEPEKTVMSESPLERRWRFMLKFRGKIKAFGTDESDEIRIQREDGTYNGLLKVWAVPFIPFCDLSSLDTLESVWEPLVLVTAEEDGFEAGLNSLRDSSDPIEKSKADSAVTVLDQWFNSKLEQPAKFQASLEKARVESMLLDRRLSEIYQEEILPEDPADRTKILIERLELAFALQLPFYNLEALVGDAYGFRWNPISKREREINSLPLSGGKLDLCALLLPSALKDAVVAGPLNWNGLNWDRIKLLTVDLMRRETERKVLVDLASRTATDPESIVFAANALEWIPTKGGGKRDDQGKGEALDRLTAILQSDERPHADISRRLVEIGQTTNALIRFMNWVPLMKSEENFRDGCLWTYAAVCDTANQLLKTLTENPELWKEEFRGTFLQHLAPQISNLDATSGKGRLLLDLIFNEKRLNDDIQVTSGESDFKKHYLSLLSKRKDQETVLAIGERLRPTFLIGGKAFGLEEAINNLPININIPPGVIVTAEALEELLMADSILWRNIIQLDLTSDLNTKLTLAKEIKEAILREVLPEHIEEMLTRMLSGSDTYAVRSSSFDEDLDGFQTGAGIYESILDVRKEDLSSAILQSLSSFFDDNAIYYRHLNGSSDIPRFAVIVQKMTNGIGGVAFSRGIHSDEDSMIIEGTTNTKGVTSGNGNFFRLQLQDDETIKNVSGEALIDQDTVKKIRQTLRSIQEFKNRDIDVEWVVDQEGKLWILQIRTLPISVPNESVKTAKRIITLDNSLGLEWLENTLEESEDMAEIVIRGDRHLDAYQGDLFTLLIKYGSRISKITTEHRVPLTSHFANVCGVLGIRIKEMEAYGKQGDN